MHRKVAIYAPTPSHPFCPTTHWTSSPFAQPPLALIPTRPCPTPHTSSPHSPQPLTPISPCSRLFQGVDIWYVNVCESLFVFVFMETTFIASCFLASVVSVLSSVGQRLVSLSLSLSACLSISPSLSLCLSLSLIYLCA